MFAKWKRFGIMDKEADKIFDQIVSSTIEKRRTYCKGSSMLVCDKATEKCVCGEFNVQVKYKKIEHTFGNLVLK